MKKRHVAAITGNGTFTVVEEPVPELKQGQVLVEVKASLISPGTELGNVAALRKSPLPGQAPRTFGYSNAGTVAQQGPGCEDIPLGTRVACMGAGYALHSNYACIPRNLLVPIPEGMDFEQAAFAHLGATALHSLRRAELEFGEHLAVFGLGLLGQLATQLGVQSGVHAAGFDTLPMRLALAEKSGAELVLDVKNTKEDAIIAQCRAFTRGHGLDCALFAFGGDLSESMKLVAKLMKKAPDTHPMGRIVVMGLAQFKLEGWPVAMGNIDVRASSRPGAGYHDDAYEHGRDYPPVFVPWTNRRNMEESLRMAALGRIDFKRLITHRLTLDNFAAGAEALVSAPNQALGVIINY